MDFLSRSRLDLNRGLCKDASHRPSLINSLYPSTVSTLSSPSFIFDWNPRVQHCMFVSSANCCAGVRCHPLSSLQSEGRDDVVGNSTKTVRSFKVNRKRFDSDHMQKPVSLRMWKCREKRGCNQGDPLSTPLFNAPLQPIVALPT